MSAASAGAAKASVIDVAGAGTVLGDIEDGDVRFQEGQGIVVNDSARKLRALLGQGYGRREFDLLLAAGRLTRCRVVSPYMVFVYAEMVPFDEDDAPITYPDLMTDELTPVT